MYTLLVQEEAVELQRQLQELFPRGGFLLRKWNSSDPVVLSHVAPELRDKPRLHEALNPGWNPG